MYKIMIVFTNGSIETYYVKRFTINNGMIYIHNAEDGTVTTYPFNMIEDLYIKEAKQYAV